MLQTTALRNIEVHWVSNLEMTLGSEKTKQVYHSYRDRLRKFSPQGMRDQKPTTGSRERDMGLTVCLLKRNLFSAF